MPYVPKAVQLNELISRLRKDVECLEALEADVSRQLQATRRRLQLVEQLASLQIDNTPLADPGEPAINLPHRA